MPDRLTPRRSFLKLDRFALAQFGRAHRLTPHARLLLAQVTCIVDHRSHEWVGRIVDLAEDCGMARTTTRKALDVLVSGGLVAEVEPFASARHGRLRHLVYESLVVLPRRTANDPAQAADFVTRQPSIRSEFGTTSERLRHEFDRNFAKSPSLTCDNAITRGIEASRDGGTRDEEGEEGTRHALALLEETLDAATVVDEYAHCRSCAAAPATTHDGYCTDCRPF